VAVQSRLGKFNYAGRYSISGNKPCYPIPGGGIRAFKPKYTTSFDAASCPLS